MTNIDKKTIEQKVYGILINRLGLKINDIKGASILKDDLGIDSFDSFFLTGVTGFVGSTLAYNFLKQDIN